MTEIYVGNLSFDVVEQDLEDLFKKFGDISGVKLIKDRETGRSKGFAFIEFANSSQAEAAVKIDGEDFKGRRIKVNIARGKSSGGSSENRDRRSW